jgi:predicted transcriptional regulator
MMNADGLTSSTRQELIKYTPEGHNDLEDLRAALDKVNSVAEHLNKHHLKAQNISKMMEIQYSLTGIGKVHPPSHQHTVMFAC